MKNTIFKKVAFLAFTMLLFVQCEEQKNIILEVGDGFVQFESEAIDIVENSATPVTATVLFGGDLSTNTDGITVNFEVTSSDNARYTVSPASGSVTIPAGESSADITITPVDNVLVDGNIEVSVKLLDTSSLPVGIGGENANFNELMITIVDNDCPVKINDFVGTYSVSENFTSGNNSPSGLSDFFNESYQLEMALDPNDISGTQLIITNSAGFNTYIVDGTVLKFDTCNNKITFDGKSEVQVALFRTYAYETSSYSEADLEIKASGPFLNFGPYQFTFTKQ